jgi:hypothetical protein|tara:strand:+ start:6142 stop:6537 length:396 start_codon:yes stop_codon:yes gene_type:complete
MDISKLIKTYIKIRDQRSVLKSDYADKDSTLLKQQDTIKEAINEYADMNKVDRAGTSEGMFYRTTKTRYWTSDWESMYKFVVENKTPEFFDKRLNQKNVREYLDENPDKLPEGLNVDTEYVISVRKNKNDK